MTFILFSVMMIAVALLLVVAAIVIPAPAMSEFEIRRRARAGDTEAATLLGRVEHYQDIVSLQRILIAVLLVGMVLATVGAYGWLRGGLIAVLIAFLYGSVTRMAILRRLSQKLYLLAEPHLIVFVTRYSSVMKWLRVALPQSGDVRLQSKEELLHVVQDATPVVIDKKASDLIVNGLQFPERQVEEIMTPRSVIDSVKKDDVLGPLLLDDLHKTGHSRFPVIDGDLDHVVGVLFLRELLKIDSSKHRTAHVDAVMDKNVYYIKETQTLDHALSAFLSTRNHLFIVVNEYRETVGIVTLEDVVEALLGRRIADEYDMHDDLRKVAERNPRGNNLAANSHNV